MNLLTSFVAYINAKYGDGTLVGCASVDGASITRCDFGPNVSNVVQTAVLQETMTYTAPPAPNPLASKVGIMSDAAISNPAKLALIAFKGLLDDYPSSPALVKQAWALIKSTDPTIDANSASLVEQHCAANGMPLV
jgi:hypothetical protein